jgi:DNA (cytosine-5)-methyltransferase 1
MTMLDNSQQSDWLQTELESMSSREDSPAKTSQPQGDKQALMASEVDCGVKSPVLLASYNPDTQSWKTSQTSLVATGDDGLDEFSETWPRSGMTRNGTAYQLPNLARTITEIGSGLWRTPAAANSNQGPKSKEFYEHCRKTGQSTITLVDEVRHTPNYWPTPTAHNAKEGGYPAEYTRKTPTLTAEAVASYWPTPSASDNRDRGNLSNPSLQRRIKLGKQLMLSQVVHPTSGKLNPTWVEWLMGFPLDHTDLNA